MKSVEKLAEEILGRSKQRANTGPQQLEPDMVEWYREFLGFDTFGEPELEDMMQAVAAFCNAFRRHDHRARYWLTLLGPCGIGKTHMAKAVFKTHRATSSQSQRYTRWIDALNYMRDGHHDYPSELAREHLLVIDDVGAEHGSEYGTQKLLEVLEKRMGKWTFITSNLGMEAFAEMDKRIASRLIRNHNKVLEIQSKDFALR